jgi:hypothetical protein
MKFEECADCYFYGVEPAMCDECEDADQFEPAEPDDDAYDQLTRLSAPAPRKVIPIRSLKVKVELTDDKMPDLIRRAA